MLTCVSSEQFGEECCQCQQAGAGAGQMIPGGGVKDTRAQAASAAAVQGGSRIVVLSAENGGVKSKVYTARGSSVTSHNTDMGTWNI